MSQNTNFTREQYDAATRRQAAGRGSFKQRIAAGAGDPGKANPVQKEPALLQQATARPPRPSTVGRKNKGTVGGDHPRFRLAITWRIADNRIHDPDGMLSSILDCLIDARGRLARLDSRGQLPLRAGSKG